MDKVNQAIFNRKNRAAIPPEHVLTPGGYRHRSLTHFVPKGYRVRKHQGQVGQVDVETGTLLGEYAKPPESLPLPALGSGWITFTLWPNRSGSPISRFVTQWIVPPPPGTESGQTIFLFNSVEDASRDDIVQPVLQWGVSGAGGGSFWTIANWYVANTGHASFSALEQVSPGDVLTGVIALVSQEPDGFNYVSSFLNRPDLDLAIGPISELVWATETLEAYQIGQCSDYPNVSQTSMGSIEIATAGMHPVVAWAITNQIVDCSQSSSVISTANPGGQIDIFY
jgi:hypothetical protein